MFDSRRYWTARYAGVDPNGWGSKGRLAEFKADFLGRFVRERGVRSILELGCGDGEQLGRYDFGDASYLGLDVPTAVVRCLLQFAGDACKRFGLLDDPALAGERADLTLSIDVIYHLVEDEVYHAHLSRLFDAADRWVVVYSSDRPEQPGDAGVHCRSRLWTPWVAEHRPEWRLAERLENAHPWTPENPGGSWSEFFVFARG
jgi:hypothetical protein